MIFLVPWPHLSLSLFFEDGATVRFVSALVAPVFPLVVFLCCLLVEVAKPGLGIAGGLQDPGCSVFFRWMKVGEIFAKGMKQVSVDLSLWTGQSKICFCRLDINFCMIFVKPKINS